MLVYEKCNQNQGRTKCLQYKILCVCFGFGFEGELKLQKKNECSNSFSSDHAEQLMSINKSDFLCLFWICSFKRRIVIAEEK